MPRQARLAAGNDPDVTGGCIAVSSHGSDQKAAFIGDMAIARLPRRVQQRSPPSSDPQTNEVVFRVSEPARRTWREELEQRFLGIGRDFKR